MGYSFSRSCCQQERENNKHILCSGEHISWDVCLLLILGYQNLLDKKLQSKIKRGTDEGSSNMWNL